MAGGGGGGGGAEGWSSRPLKIRGRPGFLKNFLRPFGPQFSLQDKVGGGGSSPPAPLPGSATGNYFNNHVFFVFTFLSVQFKYSAQHY